MSEAELQSSAVHSSTQQNSSLEDYNCTSVMLQYNRNSKCVRRVGNMYEHKGVIIIGKNFVKP